ncbi:Alpha/Beta hydrolase protein [Xylariaceae sp. FL0804]|nr:Alpha/Beta hydrolase protein [Xylariaceae sp. FL0804]
MAAKLLLLAGLVPAIAAGPLAVRPRACDDVHIFLARGTAEDYPGRQGALADAICDGLSSCGYESIVYPAAYINYCDSVYGGVVNGTAQLTAYAASCPDAQLVISGYSQGAELVGDILGGGGGEIASCTQPTTAGLSQSLTPGIQIAAVTLFGDVRHVPNMTYNVGTGVSGEGIYPRTGDQLASLNEWSADLHSWCLIDDPVCAGGSDYTAHTSYFDVYTDEAAAWVQSQLS